jgi:hypothetical protein
MSQMGNPRTPRQIDRHAATPMRRPPDTQRRLTMRLSDAGLRQGQTEALYPNHRLPPWLTEDATRDRSNRLLGGSDYRALKPLGSRGKVSQHPRLKDDICLKSPLSRGAFAELHHQIDVT